MAKKRKTKEQKKLADLRHTFQHQITNTFEIKLPVSKTSEIKTLAVSAPSQSFPYLKKDLATTIFLTSLIVAGQLILFLLLKNHIISIPGLSY